MLSRESRAFKYRCEYVFLWLRETIYQFVALFCYYGIEGVCRVFVTLPSRNPG